MVLVVAVKVVFLLLVPSHIYSLLLIQFVLVLVVVLLLILMFLSNTFQEVFKFTEGRKLPPGFRNLKKVKEGEGGEIGEEEDRQENPM